MKVILLENVRKVGSIGDIIEVKRGYGRNFLISQKKALFASKENISEVEKIKSDLNKKDQDKKNDAKKIDEKIKNKEFIVKKLSTENRTRRPRPPPSWRPRRRPLRRLSHRWSRPPRASWPPPSTRSLPPPTSPRWSPRSRRLRRTCVTWLSRTSPPSERSKEGPRTERR